MINIQNNSRLPVQVDNQLVESTNVSRTTNSSPPPSSSSSSSSSSSTRSPQRRYATALNRYSFTSTSHNQTLKSMANRKYHLNRHALNKRQLSLNNQQQPKLIQSREYKNLRQVVPSLRRQKEVGKVEVVTEAARYIDHLHKTLIERFVLCGIPESLKDILGTDNANELNSQHIMNLVTSMASSKQASAQPPAAQANNHHLQNRQRQQQLRHAARQSQPIVTSVNCCAPRAKAYLTKGSPLAATTTTKHE